MAVLFSNNATGRLAGSVDATQTTISLQAGEGSAFPSPSGSDWFPITLVKTDGALEIMHCTSRTNDVLTVTRAQEGTSAKTFAVGDRAGLRMTAGAFEQLKKDAFPTGAIVVWSGSIASIPSGWALCDGANGTIDLRDKFPVGAGLGYAVGDTGGASSVTLTEAQIPSHSHTASTASDGDHGHTASTGTAGSHGHSGSTSTTGNHSHTIRCQTPNSTYTYGPGAGVPYTTNEPYYVNASTLSAGNHSHSLSINANGNHTHSVTVNSGGAHTHGVTVNSTGGGSSHENRPPYYAIAFIQKL